MITGLKEGCLRNEKGIRLTTLECWLAGGAEREEERGPAELSGVGARGGWALDDVRVGAHLAYLVG